MQVTKVELDINLKTAKSVGREVILSAMNSMVRIRRMLSVWCVAMALAWVAVAVAEPSEDLINAADRGDAVAVQALALAAVTVYVVVPAGETVMAAVVEPLLHK